MKSLSVNLKEKSYEIVIQEGILADIKSFLNADRRVFIISNKTVFDLWGKPFGDFEVFLMEDGEKYKNFETYKNLCDKLLNAKIQRTDLIVALGGGVVGDMAGFVASTVLRGIGLIQIPTTLLAQTDSSIGGKTGIDHTFGKNLIGTFYQPEKVIIDPLTLKTLPERQIKTGLAEVVKYAFIEKNCLSSQNETFFDFLLNCDIEKSWNEIIQRCCAMKTAVVEKDEREGGLRSVLNFGHTFGHAIEKITNYEVFTHGEAVALGIKIILKLALNKNFIKQDYFEKSLKLLQKFGLDKNLDKKYDRDEIIKALKSDKKVKFGELNLIMPTSLALVRIVRNIDELSLKESLL